MEKTNGVVETHYGNGKPEERANYKDGKLDGLRETWYENGQIKLRSNYKDGKLDGLCEAWGRDGSNAKRTCFFCNSELEYWQPDEDNICNSCADGIKAEKHDC